MSAKIELYNVDCMEYLATCEDNSFELGILDPPFPINTNGGGKMRTLMRRKDWDNSIPTKEWFDEINRVCVNYMICGGNFFTQYLEPNNKWIVWHKNHAGAQVGFSEAELIYSTCKGNTRVFKHSIIGRSLDWHACPKPVKLYEWLLMNYAKEGDRILDTHLGSGSIAIACHNLGFDLVGCELDTDYFNAAKKRFEQHQSQLRIPC